MLQVMGVRALQWLRAEARIDLRRPSLCEGRQAQGTSRCLLTAL